jgi:lipopolysaccharide export system ATP-binding protein
LITDHNVRETLEVTDRSYILAEGRVVAHGNAAEIINNPDARRYYLGERFDAGGLLESKRAALPGETRRDPSQTPEPPHRPTVQIPQRRDDNVGNTGGV